MRIDEPVLAMDEIQGNILEGFNKSYQKLLGFKIRDTSEDDIGKTKRWLTELIPLITTTAEVHAFKKEFRAHREAHDGEEHPSLSAAWMNIAFSWNGLQKLVSGLDPGTFSPAFIDGQWRRALSILGDPQDPISPGYRNNWKVGGTQEKTPDIFVICAADRPDALKKLVSKVKEKIPSESLECIYEEEGKDLPPVNGVTGHEHFGFKDGISNPRPRGRISEREDDFLYPRDPNLPQNPALPEYAQPGQPLVWPGQFVLGYERQSAVNMRTAIPPIPLPPKYSWLKDGSYLVFRRLSQDVAAFRSFVAQETERLRKNPAFYGLTPERFAAQLIGRWQNGTPLVVSPKTPQNVPPSEMNAFLYLNPLGNRVPDPLGIRCPAFAHIRKVNPRDQGTNLGSAADNLRRMLLRRGIPYGPPLLEGEEKEEEPGIRGILFLSYQASIEETFETIMQNWVNSTAGPTPPPVFEMLLGAGQHRFALVEEGGEREHVTTLKAFIYATGGGYFFAPSLSAIKYIAHNEPSGPAIF